MCNYVIKVPGSNNYQFRRKIPQDLIPHYGKKEIKKSLRTSDRREAEKLSRLEASTLDAEWDSLRLRLDSTKSIEEQSPEITAALPNPDSYRDEIFMCRVNDEIAKDRHGLDHPDPHNASAYIQWFLIALRAERRIARQCGFYKEFLLHVRSDLADLELMLEDGVCELPGWRFQNFHVIEANRAAHKAFLDGSNLAAWASPPVPMPKGANVTLPIKSKANIDLTLFALVDKWEKETPRNMKTVNMYNLTATRFRELSGLSYIQHISKSDIVRFKDALLESGHSPSNTRKQLVIISTLLNFAISNAIIDFNPASGVSVKVVQKEKPRVSFDAQALNAIFGSPVYAEGLRPRAGAGEAAFWIPLLALFTGARLEEIGQLHPTDVMEEPYWDDENTIRTAWVIRINDSEVLGQSVKTKGSNRHVPIHAELVRLGFLDYAAIARAEGRRRIFDNLISDKYGTESAQFSKWFNRYLRDKCGVVDRRMSFHSFRHTFKESCRLSAIDVHDALTGHVSGKVGDGYGGDRYPLHPLVNAIKKYRVQGIDLSGLQAQR